MFELRDRNVHFVTVYGQFADIQPIDLIDGGARVVDAWAAIAKKYRCRPGLLFDLFNETHGRTADEVAGNHRLPKQVWNALYPRLAYAMILIRSGASLLNRSGAMLRFQSAGATSCSSPQAMTVAGST